MMMMLPTAVIYHQIVLSLTTLYLYAALLNYSIFKLN